MAKCLLYFPCTDLETAAANAMSKHMARLNYMQTERCAWRCRLFLPTENVKRTDPTRTLYLLDSDTSKDCYSLNSSSDFDAADIVKAGPGLASIVLRLKNLWQLRQSASIEGSEHKHNGNSVLCCRISVAGGLKGVFLIVPAHNVMDLLAVGIRLFLSSPVIYQSVASLDEQASLVLNMITAQAIL